MDGFKILSKIGEGSYSTVLKVQRIADGNVYALKRVKFVKLSDKEKLNALNEIRILASVKDKNVISYKEAFFDEKDSSLGIVMEYADNGDLFQLITERKKTKAYFKEQEIWKTFIQLLKGLKSLHELKILHRDIKSANVFLFKDGMVKLGDLNVSKVARKGLGYTQTGTPYYASPEVWKDRPYDSKSDIWSLGCVIYEMTTLKPPFQAQSMEDLYKKVIRGIYPNISKNYSEDLSDMLKLMIQVEVGARPSCEELLKMPIITKRIEYFNENKDLEGFDDDEPVGGRGGLLKTITVPNKLENLAQNLPKPNYSTDASNQSFQNLNANKIRGQYSHLITDTDTLPSIKKDSMPIIYKKNVKDPMSNKDRAINYTEKKNGLIKKNIVISNNNNHTNNSKKQDTNDSGDTDDSMSIKRPIRQNSLDEKIPGSVPRKKNSLFKLEEGNNRGGGILLPNLYKGGGRNGIINNNGNINVSSNIGMISSKNNNNKININISNLNPNINNPLAKNKRAINQNYKIINSEGNLLCINNNGPQKIKIINGDNILGGRNNSRSIVMKKKNYPSYQVNNEIAKILMERANSGHKQPNHKVNLYNKAVEDKNFLKILQQKKRVGYGYYGNI